MDGSARTDAMAVRPGAAVEAADGRLGTVDQAVFRPQTGELSYLVVRRGWTNELFTVPAEIVRHVAPSGTVHLAVTKEQARTQSADIPKETLAATPHGREVRLPLLEEELIPEKRLADLGELRIHKFVDTREELIREAVTRDDLLVERVPVNQPLEAPVDSRVEDDWLVIPIMEEVIVVQKRLMLKEEIRIRKRQVTETQELRETVRSERAEIEDATVHGVRGLDGLPAARTAPPPPTVESEAPKAKPDALLPPAIAVAPATPEAGPQTLPRTAERAEAPNSLPVARTTVRAEQEDTTKPVPSVSRRRPRTAPAMPVAPAAAAGEGRAQPDDITRPIAFDEAETANRSAGGPR